jgi:hypothetical protein
MRSGIIFLNARVWFGKLLAVGEKVKSQSARENLLIFFTFGNFGSKSWC